MTFPVTHVGSGKQDVHLDVSSSIRNLPKGNTFLSGLLDPGWDQSCFLYLLLGSGAGGWSGGGSSGRWHKSGHMKEGGREEEGWGGDQEGLQEEGQGLVLPQWRRAHIPFEGLYSDI